MNSVSSLITAPNLSQSNRQMKIYIRLQIIFILSIFCLQLLLDNSNDLNLQKQFIPFNRTLGFNHIYIIHLKNRIDRRERLEEISSYLGLDFDYFPAISKNDKQILSRYGSADMNLQQKACYLSHYFLYKQIIDKGYNSVLILEDDADFELNITAVIADIYRDLPASWDMLYLGHCFEGIGELVGKSSPVHRLHKSMFPMCTHAYAVSYSGVRKLIDLIDPVIPRGTVDYSISVVIEEKNVSSYSIHPQLIVQWKDHSDISGSLDLFFNLLNSTSRFLGY
ncbi:glycosyltransferase family 25 protein [Gigaspora rosea]|uniref:Glycosyltransferase family 25 protein n=1 Tax=Gigaspora rosea TaxID=44941 RepID=A0A397UE66_9GLOM|nr:glycosyltransferase family 25 protein [Gigaspora rosea]